MLIKNEKKTIYSLSYETFKEFINNNLIDVVCASNSDEMPEPTRHMFLSNRSTILATQRWNKKFGLGLFSMSLHIFFTKEDTLVLQKMRDLFNHLADLTHGSQTFVKSYYEQYVNKCMDRGTRSLRFSNYSETGKRFAMKYRVDVFRLFVSRPRQKKTFSASVSHRSWDEVPESRQQSDGKRVIFK